MNVQMWAPQKQRAHSDVPSLLDSGVRAPGLTQWEHEMNGRGHQTGTAKGQPRACTCGSRQVKTPERERQREWPGELRTVEGREEEPEGKGRGGDSLYMHGHTKLIFRTLLF